MMKKTLVSCFCAALAVGTLIADDTAVDQTAEMTLEQLVAAYHEAAGGEEKLSQIHSLKMVGERSEPARIGNEKSVPFAVTFQNPDSIRLDLTVREDQYTQAFDGKDGWQIWPAWGDHTTQDLPDELLTGLRKEFEMINELYRHEEKGHSLSLVGKATVQDTEVFHLKIEHATGETRDYYVDATTYLPMQMTTTRNFSGSDYAITLDFGDYKEVSGALLAHTSSLIVSGRGLTQKIDLVVNEMTINPELPSDLFSRPAPAEKASDEAPASSEEATASESP